MMTPVPRSNDNIWNPEHGENRVKDGQVGSQCHLAAVKERGQNARTCDAFVHTAQCMTAASLTHEPEWT